MRIAKNFAEDPPSACYYLFNMKLVAMRHVKECAIEHTEGK